jgi:hypothetical protein
MVVLLEERDRVLPQTEDRAIAGKSLPESYHIKTTTAYQFRRARWKSYLRAFYERLKSRPDPDAGCPLISLVVREIWETAAPSS